MNGLLAIGSKDAVIWAHACLVIVDGSPCYSNDERREIFLSGILFACVKCMHMRFVRTLKFSLLQG